ncbi:MAG TPA: tetratricopeptide repeat protein [Actinomycetota bacterium]|nr:tetratricopeptide repeat protein [Actinomycetota bacterium]
MGLEVDLLEEDELQDPFKRRIALLVVAITVFGSLVAYLQTHAGNKESQFDREAQISAIQGLSAQVTTTAETVHAYDIYTLGAEYEKRGSIARGRSRIRSTSGEAGVLTSESEHWARVKTSITPLSPLLADEQYNQNDETIFLYYSDRGVAADVAQLQQQAESEISGAWGSKSNSYVGVITLLAVALFLLGLSLTVAAPTRRFLVVPAIGIAGISVIWSLVVLVTGVPETPRQAITHMAEGNRLIGRAQYDEAKKEFGKAIAIRDDYAAAYARRADATFLAGSTGESQFVSITDPKSLRSSTADYEKAVDLGSNDVAVLGNLGFHYFLLERYEDSRDLTLKALEVNEQIPNVWWNLGVTELALGLSEDAKDSYDIGIEYALGPQYVDSSNDLFAGARTDLELLIRQVPNRKDVAEEFAAYLTAAQTDFQLGTQTPDPEDVDLEIQDLQLSPEGSALNTFYKFETSANVPVGFVWYHREDEKAAWFQNPALTTFTELLAEESGLQISSESAVSTGLCPVPGLYRLDVFTAGERILSEELTVEVSGLGENAVGYTDENLGFGICHPEGWKVDASDPDVVTFEPEDGIVSFSIAAYPVDPSLLEDADSVELEVLEAASGGNTPSPETGIFEFFGGVDGKFRFYDLDLGGAPGTMGIGVSLGGDSVMRTVVLVAPDTHVDLLNEFLASLRFYALDA